MVWFLINDCIFLCCPYSKPFVQLKAKSLFSSYLMNYFRIECAKCHKHTMWRWERRTSIVSIKFSYFTVQRHKMRIDKKNRKPEERDTMQNEWNWVLSSPTIVHWILNEEQTWFWFNFISVSWFVRRKMQKICVTFTAYGYICDSYMQRNWLRSTVTKIMNGH